MKRRAITLICMLLLTTLAVCGLGAYLKYDVLEPMGLFQEESIIKVPFQLLADDAAQYAMQSYLQRDPVPMDPTNPVEPTNPPTEMSETTAVTETPTEAATEPPTEAPTEPVVVQVDESWFDDALFIGDSRTVGLRDTARLGGADYFCKVSMTVFTVQGWKCSDKDFYNWYLYQLLTARQYGKIFIHLGLNESIGDLDLVMQRYNDLLDRIGELAPDSEIILQSVMTVTKEFDGYSQFSLENITAINQRIQALAEERGIYYLDTNEPIADEEGYMITKLSHDGAHVNGQGSLIWAQWIMDNVGQFGIE